jgi:ABC transporter transmembrane region
MNGSTTTNMLQSGENSNGGHDMNVGIVIGESTPLISAAANSAVTSSTSVIKNDESDKNGYLPTSKEQEGGRHPPRIWSRLVFDWFTPLLERGNAKKRLDQDDLNLIPLPLDCQTDPVAAAFELYWTQELVLQHQTHKHQPSLMRALFRAFGADFVRAGLLKLVHDLCVFVGPQILHAMILFLRSSENDAKSILRGVWLMLVVTMSQTLMSFCLRHYFFKCYTTGLRVRTAVVVAIYRKALLVSAGERNTRTVGEITNLMSIDAQRLQGTSCRVTLTRRYCRPAVSLTRRYIVTFFQFSNVLPILIFFYSFSSRCAFFSLELMNYLHALWYSPLQISLALFFLWQQLGPSSLGGVLVICFMIPTTKMVASWMGGMQKRLMKAKDGTCGATILCFFVCLDRSFVSGALEYGF